MKNKNQDNRSGRRALALLGAIIVITAITVAAVMAFSKLRDLWLEQCVITDVNSQITIQGCNTIPSDSIRAIFDLRNGANLALIDFAAKREQALCDNPKIKTLSVSRKLPDKLTITITERSPFAKINLKGARKDSGLVCDDEGVIFICRRGSEMLPVIREETPGSKAGDRVEGRARAALTVLETLREPEFANLNVTEIDTTRPDFLLLTLASYKTVKFTWTDMDETAEKATEALLKQLRCVSHTIATNLQPDTRVWNATQPGVVTADIYGNN